MLYRLLPCTKARLVKFGPWYDWTLSANFRATARVLCMLILTDPDAGMEFHTDTSSSVEEGFLSTFATHLRPAFAQSESLCTSASMGVVYPSYRKNLGKTR